MSIVGYIMGIGDRHPSNILVMKRSGNVVHIDFSDCFEKASLRNFVRETVPFRLTRMLVKALGPSGISGVFAMTAEYVMELMRKNRETLLAFLDIFVQDPITDTIWYKNAADVFGREIVTEEPNAKGGMLKQAITRVSRKLNGREFETVMDEKGQVSTLIEMATNEWNLSQMYYGWAPFW
jgi:phosphatidylinositol kinase/protein kinase (PI-3  family)